MLTRCAQRARFWLTAAVACCVAAGLLVPLPVAADEPLELQAGTVWAWGANGFGQLGDDGTPDASNVPVQAVGLSDMVAVAAGHGYSLAVRSDGTVWAWGWNATGRLGDGTTEDSHVPVQTVGLSDVVVVAARRGHSLALRSDGTVWGWGNNFEGQLGDGGRAHRNVPVQTVGLSDMVAVAAGGSYSLAVRSDGTVWAWGSNGGGKLGDGTTIRRRSTPVQTVGLSDVVVVAAGNMHSLAVRSDGTVWAWGRNVLGKLGDGTRDDSNVPVQTADLSDVVAVAAGHTHSLALQATDQECEVDPPVEALFQIDPDWDHLPFASGRLTIGRFGCALTALAMVLTQAGIPHTPVSLDQVLKAAMWELPF